MQLDLNADMGESFGMYTMGDDAAFMRYITSANVACGFHAGDPSVMKRTVMLAKEHNVQVGSHPGLPDLQGFGRREMNLSMDEIYDITLYQSGALKAFLEAVGMQLHHVKPHGSLYGMAHRREDVARAICEAVKDIKPMPYLYVMKAGVIAPIAESMGIRTVHEVYADLGYDGEGKLVITRHHEKHDPAQVGRRVLRMVKENKVATTEGNDIDIEGNSVSLHSDTPGSDVIARTVRETLEGAGITLCSPAL